MKIARVQFKKTKLVSAKTQIVILSRKIKEIFIYKKREKIYLRKHLKNSIGKINDTCKSNVILFELIFDKTAMN